jgi:hypothetical protein
MKEPLPSIDVIIEYYRSWKMRSGDVYAQSQTARQFDLDREVLRKLIQDYQAGVLRCPDKIPPDWSDDEV